MKNKLIVSVLLSATFSCDRVNRLTAEDYAWMPYGENQTLLFKSNFGEIDTISLLKKDTVFGYPEAQKFNGIVTQHVVIYCRHTSPIKGGHRYLTGEFFSVFRNKQNKTSIDVQLRTKKAAFYGYRHELLIEDLLADGFITLVTTQAEYEDVLVFSSDPYFSNRERFISNLYWSKSKGLVRYEKTDGECWELVEGD
jgi:hypothetical protein